MSEKSEKGFEFFTSLTAQLHDVQGLYSRMNYDKDIHTNFKHPADLEDRICKTCLIVRE